VEAELLPRSYGGTPGSANSPRPPARAAQLAARHRQGAHPRQGHAHGALKPHKIPSQDLNAVKKIFDRIESRDERYELNLYISGEDEDEAVAVAATAADGAGDGSSSSADAEGSNQ